MERDLISIKKALKADLILKTMNVQPKRNLSQVFLEFIQSTENQNAQMGYKTNNKTTNRGSANVSLFSSFEMMRTRLN